LTHEFVIENFSKIGQVMISAYFNFNCGFLWNMEIA